MLISDEVFRQVLLEKGININLVREVIDQSALYMSEKQNDLQEILNTLCLRAVSLGIKPNINGYLSEQQAVKLLEKSSPYLRQARSAGRQTPATIKVGNKYLYKMQDLAEYLQKFA